MNTKPRLVILFTMIIVTLCNAGNTPTSPTIKKFNTIGNFDLQMHDNGIIGQSVGKNEGGGYFPRGSDDMYIFGGGLWFGAMKNVKIDGNNIQQKVSTITYDPETGRSWMRSVFSNDTSDCSEQLFNGEDAFLFFSTQYKPDGSPKAPGRPNWLIWKTDNKKTVGDDGYAGNLVMDETKRNSTTYQGGPVFISDEDIVSAYNDADISRMTDTANGKTGYPLSMRYEQSIYSWKTGVLADGFIVRVKATNTSKDTLFNCWIAPAYDFDLSVKGVTGATNDFARYYNEDTTLNLHVMWTGGTAREKTHGYVGMTLLETPAVDNNGYIRHDKPVYSLNEQLGLRTSKAYNIISGGIPPSARYDLLSSMQFDADNGAGDKRVLQATGPFTLVPGDTITVAYAIIFSKSNNGGLGTGATNDMADLTDKVVAFRNKYNDQFINGIKNDGGDVAQSSVNSTTEVTPTIQVTDVEDSKMGGLSNFKFTVVDSNEVRKLLNHDLEITFVPEMIRYQISSDTANGNGISWIYQRRMEIKDVTDNKMLTSPRTRFEQKLCSGSLKGLFATDYYTYTCGDTLRLPPDTKELREGVFSTNASCYDDISRYGFHFGFNYGIEQHGGKYRLGNAKVTSGSSDVVCATLRQEIPTTQFDAGINDYIYSALDNGNAQYELSFSPGGVEEIEVEVRTPSTHTVTFSVPYYTVHLKNLRSYNTGNRTVRYPELWLDTISPDLIPQIETHPIGSYSFSAYGWCNASGADGNAARQQQCAQADGSYTGSLGRYYQTTIKGKDTLEFFHLLQVEGSQFTVDFSNKGGRKGGFGGRLIPKADQKPTKELTVNDKVVFTTEGGPYGLPMPNAKLKARVILGTVGVQESTTQGNVPLVIPNPANGYLDIINNSLDVQSIVISNTLGQNVYSRNIDNQIEKVYRVNTTDLPNGIYFIKLIGKSSVQTVQSIIQH